MNTKTLNRTTKAFRLLAVFALIGTAAVPGVAAPDAATNYLVQTKAGDRDEYVRTLQYLLRARSYKVNADGVFGAQTKSVVMSFQRAHGLKADGIVGDKTWKALVLPVKQGSKGDAVRALQNQLIESGFGDKVAVDGRFGRQTTQAVKEFQKTNVLKQDGVIGLATWNALLAEQGD